MAGVPPQVSKVTQRTYQAGKQAGRIEMKAEALSLLQEDYMAPGVERGSVEGQAILKVAADLAKRLQA